MTLSSASTDTQVEAAYDDNSNYSDGSGDITKARNFAQACRILLRRYASSVGTDATSMSRNTSLIQSELDRALTWLQAHDTAENGGGTVVADFRNARE